MHRRGWLALVLVAFVPFAHACINAVGTDHNGRKFEPYDMVGEEMTSVVLGPGEKDHWLKEPYRVIDKAREHRDFESLTNLGVLLIYQGQYAAAIRHFVFLEKHYPGHHETAANLGTALELAGQDAVALQWIRIGIQRNAQEHEGSEWLHARILQAKLSLARDPGYLGKHSVAGVRFESTLVPAVPAALPAGNTGTPVQPWQLDRALSYQLHERTQFVAPKDPIVANLLLDWATLHLAGGSIESADALYDVAVDYGAPRDASMRKRQAHIRQVLARSSETDALGHGCAICRPL